MKLTRFDTTKFDNPTLFRRTVGALQYLSLTRLDIAYSVNKKCQLLHRLCVTHWVAIKCFLGYLKVTIHYGLLPHRSKSMDIVAFLMWIGLAVPMTDGPELGTVSSSATI